MSDEGKIKVADRPPTYCSSCFGQVPQLRHIDFGAYWDGPVVIARDTEAATEQVQIDDLVICEDCLTRAANLLGLVNAPDLVAENKALKARNAYLLNRNNDLARAGRRLVDVAEITLAQKQATKDQMDDARRATRKAKGEIEQGTDQEAALVAS